MKKLIFILLVVTVSGCKKESPCNGVGFLKIKASYRAVTYRESSGKTGIAGSLEPRDSVSFELPQGEYFLQSKRYGSDTVNQSILIVPCETSSIVI